MSDGICFFGSIDRNQHGNIGGSVPAWTMQSQIEDMEEEIAKGRREIEMGMVPPDRAFEIKNELEKKEKRLDEIKNSRPKLTEAETKQVDEAYKYLGSAVANAMFTRSDMKLGLADAHEEFRRLNKGCIKVDAKLAEMAKANNLPVEEKAGGLYLSRKNSELLYKFCGHYLGASTNTEWLRRDQVSARNKSVKPKYMEIVEK